MSSGVEADIALDTAVIASLGMTRVMGGAAGLTAAGAGALADFAGQRAEDRAQALENARRYEAAIGDVLDRNARIAALGPPGEQYGIALPEPLELAAQPIETLAAWCIAADAALAEAEREVSAALASQVADRLFTRPEDAQAVSSSVVPDDERAPERADFELTPTEEAGAGQPLPPHVGETLARALARLLPDTSADDLRYVTEAAERVTTEVSEAESWLSEVRLRVQQAGERTRARRDDAASAARFRHELRAAPGSGAVRARLMAVATGRAPFDEALRAEAVRLVEREQARAERRYVLDTIQQAFGDLGYDVSEGFETLTAADGEVFLTRGDWSEHAVRLRVDDAREVRLAMVRTPGPESAEQRRLDTEREEQWCTSFEAARTRFTDAGIRTDVRNRVEPGERRVPVVARRDARTPSRVRHRERER